MSRTAAVERLVAFYVEQHNSVMPHRAFDVGWCGGGLESEQCWCDCFTVETLGMFGTIRLMVFFVIEPRTRAVHIAGMRINPYLHSLDSAAAVEHLVAFYVEQHNSVMPHHAFDGRTPDEIYFGVATETASELRERRRLARDERVAANRLITRTTCRPCETATEAVPREAA